MSHRTTSWRGSRICRRQTHSVSSPVARFRRNIARGASAGRGGGARSAGSGAARAAAEQVDEPLGVAQLGRASSGRSRGGAAARRAEYASGEIVTPSISPSSSLSDATWTPIVASSDIVASRPSPASSAAAGLALLVALGVGHQALEPRPGQLPAAAPPEPGEHPVVDLAVVAPPDEQRGARGADHAPVADVDERQRPGEVDRRRHVDRRARRPAAPARSPTASASSRRPSMTSPVGRDGQGARPARRLIGYGLRGRLGEVLAGDRAADLPDVLLVLEDDAERLVDDLGRQLRAPRATAARPPSRASRRRPAPWSGPRRAAGGRSRRPRGRAAPARRGRAWRRSRTPWPPSGSRSSGTGSGA